MDSFLSQFYIFLAYLFMASPILFFIGYEIYNANYSSNLREIQDYMKRVPLKPYLKNAYVECLFLSQRGILKVYIKEKNNKQRMIILSDNPNQLGDYDEYNTLDWVTIEREASNDDLIVADWAMIQRRFSPGTTFNEIYKMLRKRPYFTMYANLELPDNPYKKPKEKSKTIEKIEPVKKEEEQIIKTDDTVVKPSQNDERQVDL